MRTIVIFIAGAGLVALPSAWADTLLPVSAGQSVSFQGVSSGTFDPNTGGGGLKLEDELAGSLGGDTSAREYVYEAKDGDLDFFFQVYNPVGAPIDSVDLSSFAGYQTSVGYINLGEVSPTAASMSSTGDVSFSFNSFTGTSAWLEVETNATSFTSSGTVNFTSDTPWTSADDPSPTPEPNSTVMLALGLALIAIVAAGKRAQKA